MIKLNVTGHNEMCGGYAYSGIASFDGKTVKEVLDEIREYAKDKNARYLGDGFGNPKSNNCDCWKIQINGKTYWNCWNNTICLPYNKALDNLKVKQVRVDGGWYCFYDFDIITM